jgi:hypothetical protein
MYTINWWNNKNMKSIEGSKINCSNGNRTRIKVLTTIRAHICRINIPDSLTLREVQDESFRNLFFSQNIIKILSNTTIHKEFINDEARQQLFRPYQPSSGLKYKNAECLSVT